MEEASARTQEGTAGFHNILISLWGKCEQPQDGFGRWDTRGVTPRAERLLCASPRLA